MSCCAQTQDCSCVGTVVVPPCPTSCVTSTSCIRPVHVNVACNDSTGPCGEVGNFDLSTDSITTVCGGSVLWQIVSFDTDYFVSAVISAGGVVTWTTADDAPVGSYGEIIYLITCANKTLGALGTLNVCIRNYCIGRVCPEGEICDVCSSEGACIEEVADVALE